MKAKQLIAAAATAFAAASSFAGAGYTSPAEGFVSAKTRAEVASELAQAKANGSYVAAGSEEYAGQYAALAGTNAAQPQVASRSRAEVVRELNQAQVSGSYVVGGEEYAGQRVASGKARQLPAVGE